MNGYKEKYATVTKGRVGVFIDAANLERSVQDMWVNPKDIPDHLKAYTSNDLHWSVDYKKLGDFFKRQGEVWALRFYSADFGTDSHQRFLYFMKKGPKYTLITKPLKEYDDHTPERPHRKANFDVEIAVDASTNMQNYDTFVLFSGDCDFEYLLRGIRGRGKMTVVFSRSRHIDKELPPACHHYFDIIDFRDEFLRVELKKAKSPTT